jgi:hypothetical protein
MTEQNLEESDVRGLMYREKKRCAFCNKLQTAKRPLEPHPGETGALLDICASCESAFCDSQGIIRDSLIKKVREERTKELERRKAERRYQRRLANLHRIERLISSSQAKYESAERMEALYLITGSLAYAAVKVQVLGISRDVHELEKLLESIKEEEDAN